MDRRLYSALIASLAIGLNSPAPVSANTLAQVQVTVSPEPLVSGDLHIRVKSHSNLPPTSDYYAVVVLKDYRHYSSQAPPPCAISSDMSRTEYSVAHHGTTHLTLSPAASAEGRWCPGNYIGAIYTVPHSPNCNRGCPSAHKDVLPMTETPSIPAVPGESGEGEPYSYPGGLPKSIGRNARIIGRFEVGFLTSIPHRRRDRIPRTDGPIMPCVGHLAPLRVPRCRSPQLTDPGRDLEAGFGWAEIVLSFQFHSGLRELDSCSGGIAVENGAGLILASAGYTNGPFGGGPGIASGSTTTFVLAPGTWRAFATAGRDSFASATFTVAAGLGSNITIQLP